MDDQYVRRLINAMRPSARFIKISYTRDFLPPEAGLGDGFPYVALHDAQFTSNVWMTGRGPILISNSYLPSFAYNLGLAYLQGHEQGLDMQKDVFPLLKYNFKKFFAEQMLHDKNTTFGRAIFLETLVYDQFAMIPVFRSADDDDAKAKLYGDISGILSNLVLFHEMAHYYQDHHPEIWKELVQAHGQDMEPLLGKVRNSERGDLYLECYCDMAALFMILLPNSEEKLALADQLRIAAFGYGCFAAMLCLERSATKTNHKNQETHTEINLSSTQTTTLNAGFEVEADRDMIFRAQIFIGLCEQLAEKNGLTLYGQAGIFPLEPDFLLPLLNYVNHIAEPDDVNQRSMAQLLAESLHGHPKGLEFLIGRSVVFRRGDGTDPADDMMIS